MVETCYVTAGLLDALLSMAADREPESVSTLLAVTPYGDLEAAPRDRRGAGAAGERGTDPTGGHGTEPAGERGTAPPDERGSAPADRREPAPGGPPRTGGPNRAGKRPDHGVLDPGTPVFTDFYVPSAGRSVDAVFGVDVSVPHAQAQGRFVSHPLGELEVSTTDDLHEVVLVAVPPWTRDDVAAFDRGGRRLDLRVLEAAPPERQFDG